jgi:hypothetical protein
MIAKRIPQLALAVCALGLAPGGRAQQPAAPAPQATAGAAPTAPQGNLTIQVMSDDGTPVPGADLAVDGMRTGQGPVTPGQAGVGQPGSGAANGAVAGNGQGQSAQTKSTQPGSTSPPGMHCISAAAASIGTGSTQAGSGQTGSGNTKNAQQGTQQGTRQGTPPGTQPGAAQSGNAQAGQTQSGSDKNGGSKPVDSTTGNPKTSAKTGPAAPAQNCYASNTVLPGTSESIGELVSSAPTNGDSGPPLPPGAIPLRTDAQGQLVLQLPPGSHTLAISVYGFEPWNGSFTLNGKHRQIVQIKLSTAQSSFVLAVGPDDRIQLESPDLEAPIPLEPLQTLVLEPRRGHRSI